MKKHLGFALNIIAIGLFIPGIILPMLSLSMEMGINVMGSNFTPNLIDKELSIIATVEELWLDQRFIVAILIFLFSVCIPLLKTSLVSLSYFIKNADKEAKILKFVASIGKWSMADVFTVAIFLAILSTNHSETANREAISAFGLNIDLLISSQTLSAAGAGFYYFTGYCLLSLLGTHLSQSSHKTKTKAIIEQSE